MKQNSKEPFPMPSVGVDVESIARFRHGDACGPAFLKRVFLQSEIEYCERFSDPWPHFAGTFCAKEAVVKAAQSFFPLIVSNIEVGHRENRSPYIKSIVHGDQSVDHLLEIEVSISHCDEYAMACALIRKKEQ
ncbi:MAG: 4'-phosphopantetheinyl transferase superfamily protein [Bdellovibrionota bacterium]